MFTSQDRFYSDILIFSKNIENMLAFISFINRCSYSLLSSKSSLESFKSNVILPWAKLWKLSEGFLILLTSECFLNLHIFSLYMPLKIKKE